MVMVSNSDPIIRRRSSAGTTASLGGKGAAGRARGDDAACKSARPPLHSADLDNVVASAAPSAPRPKGGKVVSSRYLSSSSSNTSSSSGSSSSVGVSPMKRCPSPSPSVSRTGLGTAATPSIKRSQSAERRRPGTPRTGSTVARDPGDGKTTGAQRMLASARSLSVSFQGESYSVPVDKVKVAAEKPTPVVTARPMSGGGGLRKGTPDRSRNAALPARRASTDSLKVAMEHKHRWPGRSAMSMSVDFGNATSLNRSVVRDLRNSMMASDGTVRDGRIDKLDSQYDLQFKNEGCRSDDGSSKIACSKISASEFTRSDGESVSSGSISNAKASTGIAGVVNNNGCAIQGGRGIEVQARFWQEESNRLSRPPSPMAAASKLPSTPKKLAAKGPGSDSPVSSPKGYLSSRRQASPLRSAVRPGSPSKFGTLLLPSPTRGLSPSRVRTVAEDSVVSSTPSILSFAAEARRGKMGESRIVDAHALRLLHNRLLQWRFVSARADDALFVQRLNAEGSLYNSWVRISKLREAVKAKELQLQLLRHILKLSSVLNGQMVFLEKWDSMEDVYSDSLLGATESLHASTLRLPVIGSAKVNVQKLKVTFHSALEMLQAIAASVCISSAKVSEVHHFVTELADVTLQERALLDHCTDLLSTNAAMQINECSLRAHISQQKEVSSVVG